MENTTGNSSGTRRLTESALLIALATALSLYKLFEAPYGGAVTLGSMIPIMLISIKYRFGWSLIAALAYSLIQMMTGFWAPPIEEFLYYALMILLDYVIAFGVLCLAGPIYNSLKKKIPPRIGLIIAVIVCFSLRFLCHFTSGIIIWGVYAPEGQAAWLYSLLYNGGYMLFECIISGGILFVAGPQLIAILEGKRR